MTLTTRHPDTEASVYRRASGQVFQRLRRLYGHVEYFGAIEFTTGRAPRSGGSRRLHGHYLTKGLDPASVLEVESVVQDTWRASTGARGREAWRIEVAALVSPGAAIGYVGLHHRKPQQAPPAGWRGMVERYSRGYFTRPIGELRTEARLQLRAEAIAWAGELDSTWSRIQAELEAAKWDDHRARVIRVSEGGPVLIPRGEVASSW